MPIEFRCTQCDKLLRTADDAAGKQAKCPECGAISAVPVRETGPPQQGAACVQPPPPPGSAAGSAENAYQAPGHHGPTPTPPYPGGMPREVPNYLVQSILCTLCCCLPFGIVAIVFAAQVNTKLAVGDYAGALQSSNLAKGWCLAAFITGLIGIALWFMLVVAAAMG